MMAALVFPRGWPVTIRAVIMQVLTGIIPIPAAVMIVAVVATPAVVVIPVAETEVAVAVINSCFV